MGNITELNDSAFNKFIVDTKVPVIIDFGSEWCGPCKQTKSLLKEIDPQLQGKYAIGMVDIDKAPKTAAKYEISVVPTFVIFKEGKEVGRFSGYNPAKEFMEKIETLLTGKNIENKSGEIKQPELSLDLQLIQQCFNPDCSITEIKKLLGKGANPNYIIQLPSPADSHKVLELTSLLVVSDVRNNELMIVLLDAGADLQLKTQSLFSERSLTFMQQLEEQISLVKEIKNLLISHKPLNKKLPIVVSVDQKESELLNQQLCMAVALNNKSEVKELLEKGANPNYNHTIYNPLSQKNQITIPLSVAVNKQNIDIISILLDAGAKTDNKFATSLGEDLTPCEFLDRRLVILQDQLTFLNSYKKPIESKDSKK